MRILYAFMISILCACNGVQVKGESTELPVKDSVDKPTIASVKKRLTDQGYQIFDYVDEQTGDTILMQQYFIAFLKSGPNRSQSKEVADSLQRLHLAHLGRMYEAGYADISGPFGDDGEIRGITIYNVPTQKMADSLAGLDPMVRSGRLVIEIHPWWAAKGFPLR
ncbi:YciI family protein [Robertkochia solimangrovi]|uniref:YciI family protein n=1 Tax=Robertkochia solimangrovi TaxID=2213046 RepID=UPI003BAEC525